MDSLCVGPSGLSGLSLMLMSKRTLVFTLAAASLLVACGGEEPAAGNPGTSNNSFPECYEIGDSCSGERVCIAGTCEAAFNRFYRVTIRDGELPATKPEGGLWDEGTEEQTRPDPYVVIKVDGVEIGRTSTQQDTWFPTWNEVGEAQFIAGSRLEMTLFDEDLIADDQIFACSADPITPDFLRERDLICRASQIDDLFFTVRVEPKT